MAPQEHLDVATWEDEMLSNVLKVTLDVRPFLLQGNFSLLKSYQRKMAEETGFDLVWLKGLQLELEAEDPSTYTLIVNSARIFTIIRRYI